MDLAKVDTPSRAIPQTTFNRETTMPRANTDRPDREVNAGFHRPAGTSNAEALAKLLGVAADTANNIVGDIQAKKDNANQAQAVFDFASGNQNQDLYKNSRAYYESWQLEGAKAKSLDIAQQAVEKVQTVLNNPDATAEDADAAIESVFQAGTHDEKGKLLDFGTPEAKMTLGHSLAEVKSKLMPEVHKLLKERQDQRLMGTAFDNLVVERDRGAPIGDPNAVGKPSQPVLTDPLAPLPSAPDRAPTHSLARLQEPFQGFNSIGLTGRLGDQRSGHVHNGEDFPVHAGTAIMAPMGGEVISSFNDTQHGGGETVRVKLANGAIVGFAHLSERHAQVGDKVSAGELLGLSGATGDATGPHVHMTVVVNGKHVSPRDYFKKNQGDLVVATGAEPQLATSLPTDQADPYYSKPGLDVETFLSRLPPTIDKGEAKTYFIQGAIAKAFDAKDPTLLNGLENSKRPDGSPSFTPAEQLQIERTRQEIKTAVDAENERTKNKLQSDNLDLILNAYNSGNPPSDSWLASQGAKGLIDPKQAYTLISHNRELRKQAETEAKQEQRLQKADTDAGITNDVNSLAVAMEAGVPSALAVSDEELRKRFQNGEFGPLGDRNSLARYRTLMTAHRQGVQRIEQSPDFARYSAQLEQFKPITIRDPGNPLLAQLNANHNGGPRLDKPTYTEMVAFYKEQVDQGKSPGDAYRAAVDKYARKAFAGDTKGLTPAAAQRLSYLKCKQAGVCQ